MNTYGISKSLDRLYGRGTLNGLTEAELLDRFVSDQDEVAFESLIELHRPLVLRICQAIFGDHQEAEDAFQATFLVFVQHAGTIRNLINP